jgi:hypothetical protein
LQFSFHLNVKQFLFASVPHFYFIDACLWNMYLLNCLSILDNFIATRNILKMYQNWSWTAGGYKDILLVLNVSRLENLELVAMHIKKSNFRDCKPQSSSISQESPALRSQQCFVCCATTITGLVDVLKLVLNDRMLVFYVPTIIIIFMTDLNMG